MSLEILKPFGPSIVKVKIPSEILFEMNQYVDDMEKDKKKLIELDHGPNLIGNVYQEFRLDIEFMKKIKWAEFLAKSCQQWLLEGHNITIKKFEIVASWIVKQFKNEYNPIHYHSGQISGVGYLKVPKNFGSMPNKTKNPNGKLELIHGSRQFLSNSTFSITPEVGDFYFFPNYMMHTVYPFTDTDEERRSISFNAFVDQSIYDTF